MSGKHWGPHPYQKRGVRFVLEERYAGLLLKPGLGKTSIVYAGYEILRREKMVKRALVIAPLRTAVSTWPNERDKWKDFNHLRVHVLHGEDKEALFRAPHDISVVNPEGLEWLLGYTDADGAHVPGAVDSLKSWPWEMLIVDESTKFKNTATVRFKTLRPVLPRFKRRVILTGTPAPNGLMDLYGQIFVLDLGRIFSPYVTHFQRTYFNNIGGQYKEWVPKSGARERIERAIEPITMAMEAGDYLKLPPLIPNYRWIELDDDARRVYGQMETLMLAEVQGGLVTAVNAAAVSAKCRQIANGGLYGEDGETYEVHRAKAEMVADIVEELSGKPAMIAYEFQHDLERLRAALGEDTPHIGGGVTPKRQREIEAKWNAGKLRALLVQPQSVAHGLNLQDTPADVIWHSIPWNLEDYEQTYQRVHRQGQREPVVMHHIGARGTVDELVVGTLKSKARTQNALFSSLRNYAAAREAQRPEPEIDLRKRGGRTMKRARR